jgi:hypothetical protein
MYHKVSINCLTKLNQGFRNLKVTELVISYVRDNAQSIMNRLKREQRFIISSILKNNKTTLKKGLNPLWRKRCGSIGRFWGIPPQDLSTLTKLSGEMTHHNGKNSIEKS